MARPTKLQRVFAYLRHLRPFDSDRDLLALAGHIIKADSDPEALADFHGGRGRPPFSAMPIDRAFRDGGWMVMEFERRAGFYRED